MEIKKNWWMLALRGAILVALSLFIFGIKDTQLVFRSWGVAMIALGGGTLYYGIQRKKKDKPWIYSVLIAVIDIVLGVLVLIYTDQVVKVFRLIVGGWAVGIGFVLIYMALKSSKQKWLLQINGMVSTALGVLIIVDPFGEEKRFDSIILGIYSALLGSYLVLLAYRMRSKTKDVPLEIVEAKHEDGTESDEEVKS